MCCMAYNKEVNSILMRNEETVAHMKRCGNMARHFAIFLGLSLNEIDKLEKCALFHDIGKLFLPPDVLYKKGKLTEKEFKLIKSHTSFEIPKMYDCEIQESIAYHHERPDGNGYMKMEYEKLSMYPKIVSLIDVFDVMNNPRCYKTDISDRDEIISEIEANLNSQFDMKYGKLFIEFLQNQ